MFKQLKHGAEAIARRTVPSPVLNWMRARRNNSEYIPPVGWVRFGSFRRRLPLSDNWGFDRGAPIDRYYIERFLAEHSSDICGHVLEIGDNRYTRRIGGTKVTRSDVLHVKATREATIVTDLAHDKVIPSETFDCIICTQTLQAIYDVRAAIRTLYRV